MIALSIGAPFLFLAVFFGSRFRQQWSERYGRAEERMGDYKYGLAETIAIDGLGLRMLFGIGDSVERALPWDEFVGFREGQRILLLIQKGSHEELLTSKAWR